MGVGIVLIDIRQRRGLPEHLTASGPPPKPVSKIATRGSTPRSPASKSPEVLGLSQGGGFVRGAVRDRFRTDPSRLASIGVLGP
jgi:hypothetical protein